MCDEIIQKFLKETLDGLVLKERQGSSLDRRIFKMTTELLMVLGNNNRNFYQSYFEEPLLQQTAKFFKVIK